MKPKFKLCDLFCGAGGSTTGAVRALERLGFDVEVTAVNHWDTAIATHSVNYPAGRHFCASVDALNPRTLFKEGELNGLWASPECVFHSIARGGKPVDDQRRATAWCVVRWAEATLPDYIWVENVKEFADWGPLKRVRQKIKGKKNGSGQSHLAWVPDKKRRGETFHAWVNAIRALGYRVEWRVLCAADFGAPTTRRRLFICAVRGKTKEGRVRRIVWPDPTHAENSAAPDLFREAKPWAAAATIINWEKRGQSIFTRKRPLCDKTLKRIWLGMEKFGLQGITMSAGGPECPARPITEPLGTVLCRDHRAIAVPFIVGAGGPERAGEPQPVDKPLGTVLPKDARHLVQPFILPNEGVHGGNVAQPVDKPLHTVVAGRGAGAIVQPYLVELRGTEQSQLAGSSKSIDRPMPTVTAGGGHVGVVQPTLGARVIDPPDPFLIHTAHDGDGRVQSTKEPLPTVVGNRGDVALIQPFVIGQQSDAAPRPTHEPLPTVATAGAISVVQPYIVGIDHQSNAEGAIHSGEDPLSTVTSKARHAVVEPMLIKFYGSAEHVSSVKVPLDTVTTKERFGLAQPIVEIAGKRYLLDILFRMLDPQELAAAQGFPRDYQFTGTKTSVVRQVGNAVPPPFAEALVAAAVRQNPVWNL